MSLRYYETVIMTKPVMSDRRSREVIASLIKPLKELGHVVDEEYWGLRSLAYSIKNATKAYYTLLVFHTSPENMEHLNRETKMHESVIRHLSLKVDAPPTLPTPIMIETQKLNEETHILKEEKSSRH